jgi:membrane protease YdiL (CAAX protease family)
MLVAWEAMALVALSFLALMTAGTGLAGYGLAGTVAAELVCIVAPTAAFLAARRVPPAELGLGRVSLLGVAGGLVFGAAAFYLVAVGEHAWLERILPTPPAVERSLERMIVPAQGARALVVDLAGFALVPALAEELLFRGVVFGALRPRLGAVGAVVGSAVAFALYHGSIYRLIPALVGGLFLGGVRAGSRSLWPALAFHFANNVVVVVALRAGWSAPPPALVPFGVAALTAVAGAALVVRSRP